jgi:hypothetical protein
MATVSDAGDAALGAARSDPWYAAADAVRAKAREALRPTVERLQRSALALLDLMSAMR